MSIYKNAFLRAIIEGEGNVAGSGGPLGDWTQSHFSGDFYAPGDARRPFALGAMQRRAGVSKKKRKKKKKKGKKKKSTIKEYRNIGPVESQPSGDEQRPSGVGPQSDTNKAFPHGQIIYKGKPFPHGQRIHDASWEFIRLVQRADTDEKTRLAVYNIKETWDGWDEDFQNKLKNHIRRMYTLPGLAKLHRGPEAIKLILSIIDPNPPPGGLPPTF